jgi:hypothetical protein
VWAIFDSAAVARTGWKIRYPYIADPPDGYFHKADTVAELAKKVMENAHQKMPLKYLEQTVTRYNELVDKGVDEDFEKPVMHKVSAQPFYAAWAPIGMLVVRRSSDKRESAVVDCCEVISGLYAGGEASGGGQSMVSDEHPSTATSPGPMRLGKNDLSFDEMWQCSAR